jgi:hypothetical protein
MCSFQIIFNILSINCTTSVTKASLLSDPIDTGILNQGMISFNRDLATSCFFFFRLSGEGFYPSWKGTDKHQQTSGIVSGTQTAPFTYCLTYTGEFRDIKILGQDGLESCLPWVGSFMELFDKCGRQWHRYSNVAISKLPPSIQYKISSFSLKPSLFLWSMLWIPFR